jgi:hypothetical protein
VGIRITFYPTTAQASLLLFALKQLIDYPETVIYAFYMLFSLEKIILVN